MWKSLAILGVVVLVAFAYLGVAQTPNNAGVAQSNGTARTSQPSNADQKQQRGANQPTETVTIINQQGESPQNKGLADQSGEGIEIQRSLAKFTKYLVWVGIAQAIVVLGTLIVIFLQIRLAKDTAKRQLRAYLCVSQATLRFTKIGQITTQIYIKNAGQTPAYGVRAWGSNVIREHPLTAPLGRPSGESMMADGIIAPDGEHIMIADPLLREKVELGSVYKLDHALYAHGECSYRDIYGITHTLEYRLIWGGPARTKTEVSANGETVAMLCMDIAGNKEWDN